MNHYWYGCCHPQVPNYYKVIVRPMDLSNVRAKLQTQNFAHYQNFDDFVADCRLIFENCAIFNEVSARMNARSVLLHSLSCTCTIILLKLNKKNKLKATRVSPCCIHSVLCLSLLQISFHMYLHYFANFHLKFDIHVNKNSYQFCKQARL